MSFNLSAIAVRERAVTLFFIILLAAAGAYAFLMLGRAEHPSFTIKTLTVTTAWPGATAHEMQDLVAEPLEKRLQELTWYDRVETTTRPGYAYMTVTLKRNHPAAFCALLGRLLHASPAVRQRGPASRAPSRPAITSSPSGS